MYNLIKQKSITMNMLHLAAYGLIIRDESLLLIKKTRGPFQGLLDLPGGKIQENETIEQALQREILEETGITAHTFTLLDNYYNLVPHAPHNLQHIGLVYTVTDYSDAPIDHAVVSSDSEQPGWYDIAELTQDHLTPFAHKAVLYLKEILL
jgi:mutator protein MutT